MPRGGPRANSGGARPGAGRPKKAPAHADVAAAFVTAMQKIAADTKAEQGTPLAFLLSVMRGDVAPTPEQLKAAIAAAPFVHLKQGEGGKKEQRQTEAESIASGKFGARQPPKLVASR